MEQTQWAQLAGHVGVTEPDQLMEPAEFLKEYSTIVGITAAAISLLALLVSWRGIVVANRAYSLSELQDRRRTPGVRLDLLSSWFLRSGDERRYALNVTISNPTDAQNSITRAELLIHLTDESSGRLSSSIIKIPAREGGDWIEGANGSDLLPPLAIDARSAWSGWAKFSVRQSLIAGSQIERVELRVEDVFGNPTALDHVNPRIVLKESR